MFKRAATELLSLRNDDVQSVLLATVQGKHEDMKQYVDQFSCFNGWSVNSIKECCILSTVKRYLPDTIILDGSDVNNSYTYFIIDGTCTVVQKLTVLVTSHFDGRKVFKIVKNGEGEGLETIYMEIRKLKSKECFGLGEDLHRRWILSSSPVRCLVIPKDFLLRHNQNNIWPRVRQKINSSFPTDLQIWQSLRQQVKWSRFKTDLFGFLQRRSCGNGTRYSDVPINSRINTDVPSQLL